MFHYSVDGDIIMKDTPEANDQIDMLENKQRQEKQLLHSINASIIAQFGKDPRKYLNTLFVSIILMFVTLCGQFILNLNLTLPFHLIVDDDKQA